MHIGKSKIYISILVCFGIFLFNAYTSNNETDNINKPLTVFSFLVILTLLIFEGYRPDIQAQIRSEFHPSPSLLFYSVATIIFLTMLAISIVTLDLFKICAFVWNHDTLAKDLMVHGCLGVFGDIFVYRLLLLHRQHIVPLISTIRRITTSMVNILWFHHTITFGQYIGIAIICIGIFLELFSNYL